jgi:hypothetical protein
MGEGILGLRKFVVTLVALGSSTGLMFADKITSESYAEVMVWAVGLYVGANVMQSVAKRSSVTIGKPVEGEDDGQ